MLQAMSVGEHDKQECAGEAEEAVREAYVRRGGLGGPQAFTGELEGGGGDGHCRWNHTLSPGPEVGLGRVSQNWPLVGWGWKMGFHWWAGSKRGRTSTSRPGSLQNSEGL